MKKRTLALLFLFAISITSFAIEPLLKTCESTAVVNVNVDDDDKSLIDNPRFLHMNKYKIISGPELKKYAIAILTLPDGWVIGGMSTLDYMKRLSNLIAREGDCWGTKHECTILAEIQSGEIYRYILIVESMDEEDMAILSAAAGHGGFEEVIYTVINYKNVQKNTYQTTNEGHTSVNKTNVKGIKPTITVNGVSFTMVKVEGGTFEMGAQNTDSHADNYDKDAYYDETPVHSVTLSDYYIGETEVTQELWQAVMGTNPSHFKGNKKPVEKVSWDDCQEFIKKLNQYTGENFRLPTEAEWEYAARGGRKSQGYRYSGSNKIKNVAWYDGKQSGWQTHDVKTKAPNELGIYDMSGNVWEWCQDWYGNYSGGSQTNPTGPSSSSYRVRRGGAWFGDASFCRVSHRDDTSLDFSNGNLGFRLCL